MSPRRTLLTLAIASAVLLGAQPYAPAQTPAAPARLEIGGAVSAPLALSAADLKALPRQTLRMASPRDAPAQVYEGVALGELLQRAGVPRGETLRGPWLASYVIAEGADGYRVVFSLAELDAGFRESEVLVADTMNGLPLPVDQGAFKLIVPQDRRPARWVRMLKTITVVRAGN